MRRLTANDWPVSLTNQATGQSLDRLPGIYQNMTIARPLEMDEAATEGKSGRRKQPQGWDDAEITLTLLLIDDAQSTALDKLAELEAAYTAVGPDGKPPAFIIHSPHTRARKIRQVLWVDLRSSETNEDLSITVDLVFREHTPVVAEAEDRGAPKAKPRPESGAGGNTPPLSDTPPPVYRRGW